MKLDTKVWDNKKLKIPTKIWKWIFKFLPKSKWRNILKKCYWYWKQKGSPRNLLILDIFIVKYLKSFYKNNINIVSNILYY